MASALTSVVSTMDSNAIVASALAIVASYTLYRISRKPKNSSLPPGPKGWPVIGNLLDVPLDVDFWKTFRSWGQQFDSEVIHMSIFGINFIILNSMQATKDLLEKRGKIYSARMSLPMFDIAEYTKLVAFETNTKRWAAGRRLIMSFLTGKELPKLYPVIEDECAKLPLKVYREPGKVGDWLEETVVSVIMRTTYGYTPTPNDRFTHITFKLLDEMLVAARPTSPINIFPFLRFVPSWVPYLGSPSLQASAFKETMTKVVKEPYEWHLEHKDDEEVKGSLCAKFTEMAQGEEGKEIGRELAEWTAAVQFIAGADTTTFTLHAALKALLLNPDVQKKAQAQLDSVCGHRLPTMDDRPKLDYLDAILKETSRWHLLGPFGAPHMVDSDDEYNGHFIPKGSIILPNMGAIASDATIYPDPEAFKPERHLGEAPELDSGAYNFGFGRRVCPGKALAQAEMFLTIATLIKVFDVRPWTSEKDGVKAEIGEDRPPGMDMPRRPTPYAVAIKLRNEASLELVQGL
ncbi:cytochrome P450 [Coprinellus micaceus]|uniref:Cytochrome P450 n=1 Tax=Coprinellus micaceus TaxID=71717 RepID=A0A4Y7T0T4_COPMI|nr:cytochrome P450 [Coprinellus micaceus]